MMTKDGSGILNDWDLAKRFDGGGPQGVRQHERTVSRLPLVLKSR